MIIAREYRQQLARNEDEALRRLSRYWVRMEQRLTDDFEALARETLKRQAKGEAIPRQFLYTMKRYQSMLDQLGREMPGYQMTAENLIRKYQVEDYQLGLDAANAIIKASKPSSDMWTRIYKDAAETMAGFAGNGAPLYDLLYRDYQETAESVLDALVEGVGLGKGYREVAKDMRDAMGMEYDRSLRIARTEINRSYRLANAEQYRRSGVVEKVLRLCYKPTACFACLMMDGEECPNGVCDDHPNGKCTTIVQTTGGVVPEWQKGPEWLEEQSPEDQRRIMGAGRYEAWKAGEIEDLRDLVRIKPNEIWGGSPSMISMQEMNLATATERRMFHDYSDLMGDYLPTRYLYDFVSAKHEGGIEWARIQYDHDFILKYGANKDNPPLSNIENAFDINKKLVSYALSPTHERGKHKALVFEHALGYTLENADLLESQIRQRLSDFRMIDKGITQYGHKFDVKLLIDGVNGNKQPIITCWQYDTGSRKPRMVTVYVDKNKRP